MGDLIGAWDVLWKSESEEFFKATASSHIQVGQMSVTIIKYDHPLIHFNS